MEPEPEPEVVSGGGTQLKCDGCGAILAGNAAFQAHCSEVTVRPQPPRSARCHPD